MCDDCKQNGFEYSKEAPTPDVFNDVNINDPLNEFLPKNEEYEEKFKLFQSQKDTSDELKASFDEGECGYWKERRRRIIEWAQQQEEQEDMDELRTSIQQVYDFCFFAFGDNMLSDMTDKFNRLDGDAADDVEIEKKSYESWYEQENSCRYEFEDKISDFLFHQKRSWLDHITEINLSEDETKYWQERFDRHIELYEIMKYNKKKRDELLKSIAEYGNTNCPYCNEH